MGIIFLFVDGVGLGKESDYNPFGKGDLKGFSAITNGQQMTQNAEAIIKHDHTFKPVDATLGVDGLPQSGTGQTALFTGKNASKEIGKHFGPFPHSGIKHILKEQSLFHQAQSIGKSCRFINAYPDIFFRKAEQRNRWSCTTLMTKSAKIPLNTTDEVKEEVALTAEITQQAWRNQLNIAVPSISPEEAANRLLHQSQNFDLILHEYYLTDKAGHSQEMHQALNYLEIYDRFLNHLMQQKRKDVTIVLCSDHGNIEDLSTKTHTLNPVPLLSYGPGAPSFSNASSIMDVTPAILEALQKA